MVHPMRAVLAQGEKSMKHTGLSAWGGKTKSRILTFFLSMSKNKFERGGKEHNDH